MLRAAGCKHSLQQVVLIGRLSMEVFPRKQSASCWEIVQAFASPAQPLIPAAPCPLLQSTQEQVFCQLILPPAALLFETVEWAAQVTEAQVMCSDNGRDAALYFLLACHPGRTLVFVNAVSALRRLVALLKLLQLPVRPLHAGLQQRQRLKALQQFRSNPQCILVASDVAARGLDIPVGPSGCSLR